MEITKETLENLIFVQKQSYVSIGKLFGISDNAVKKKAKKLGISLPQRRIINECENFSHCCEKSQTSKVYDVSDELFIDIINSSTQWKEICEKLGYSPKGMSSNVKKNIFERCEKLGIDLVIQRQHSISKTKKGELRQKRRCYQSYRSAIRKNAEHIFYEKCSNPVCKICGYDKHIEIAHIKAVSEFDDDALIEEINSIDNLIALCPNHHWEYDNGLLQLD